MKAGFYILALLVVVAVIYGVAGKNRSVYAEDKIYEPPQWLKDAIIGNTDVNDVIFIQAVKDGFLEHGEWGEDLRHVSSKRKLKDNSLLAPFNYAV